MIIQSERVWIAGLFLPAQIIIENGTIQSILPHGTCAADVDYGKHRIIPGMIDIHTHGAYGYDTNDGEPEGLKAWMRRIPEEGVTSILPTTVTQMPDILENAVASVAAVVESGYIGAEILGIHFEGPYLDMDYKGAQPPEAIAAPSVAQFQRYQEKARGLIRYITLSPEHDEDFELTKYCASHGVVVSMGHSSATYETACMAVANGAASTTHVYNGMTPFKHREPGLVGAAFRIPQLYGEIIADGYHSDPASLKIFFNNKGSERAMVVSDSLRAKHCPPSGDYTLGNYPIEIKENGLAYLKDTDVIAGSTLKMNQGLRLLIEEAGVPVEAAINACTLNPAKCIGVDDRKGRICAGCDADMVVLDAEYGVVQTYCKGMAMLEG